MGRRPKEECITLKYTGNLDGAKTVYVHYGIGDNWDNVEECKMRKLKYCYKTEITVPTGSDVHFCFHDQDGNWDNNCGCNYCYNSYDETPVHYDCVEAIADWKKEK